MNIVGISYTDGPHDTSAAIVCDGVLVAAAEEERFTRRKREIRPPLAAVDFCLARAGLDIGDVDLLVIPEKPFFSGWDSYVAELEPAMIEDRPLPRAHKRLFDWYRRLGPRYNVRLHRLIAGCLAALRRHFSRLPPIRYYDHHSCHAAAAHFTSGRATNAVATVDFNGGPFSTVTWRADGARLTRLRAQPYPNSLGLFYLQCMRYLGLGVEGGEGKLMALASYGDPQPFAPHIAGLIRPEPATWYHYDGVPSAGHVGFPPRTVERIDRPPYTDFAAAVQRALEQSMHDVVRSAVADAGTTDVCLGGGVTLNCACNGKLAELARSLWLFPACNDAGLSVGGALLAAAEAGELQATRLRDAYLGPEFSHADIERALTGRHGLRHREVTLPELAQRLARGEIVGWFDGRMEMGPRALGHRSLLADPRSTDVRDRVNRLKGRELWRPLAPVVTAEAAGRYFQLREASPFMLVAARVRDEQRAAVPGIVHVDGTARPQTLEPDQNPRLHALLEEFGRATGIAMLINTSFNLAGEPIVCTPDDAITTFVRMGIDCLVLSDRLVERATIERP